ncbi:MAG TPA: formate dehydrogenase accessory sulfurtransferase FdhD [Mycobacteriales bacterium]|nr:formate dehydrogenase accessory sulfurtransferase FdhD [Mycobacteriales bacterium]
MGRITQRRRVTRIAGEAGTTGLDTLVVEEPLEIRLGGEPVAVTMRTPGHDMDLAAGFLVSEGLVVATEDLRTLTYCAGDALENQYNVLDARLAGDHRAPASSVRRALTTSSACGLCGKAQVEQIRTALVHDLRADPTVVDAAFIRSLPDRLRGAQEVFDRTGGLHAAGLFDAATGALLVVREDVGRHNAVDKVVGWALRDGRLPLRGTVLFVSGRASFELAQKAAVAGIPVLAAVSAASSLAVDLAEETGLTLIGFVREDRMVVYAGAGRIALSAGVEVSA